MSVIASTIEPDGYEYFVIDSPYISWVLSSLVRSDSAGLYTWNTQSGTSDTICRYDAKVGDAWGHYRLIARQIGPAPGNLRRLEISGSCGCNAWLAEGVGVTSMSANGPDIQSDLIGGIIDGKAWGSLDVDEKQPRSSTVFLTSCYPNPFAAATAIDFTLTQPEHVTLKIFNSLGQEIVTLVDAQQSPGHHTATFNAEHLQIGVYWYRLTAGKNVLTQKMIVVR